MNYELADVLGRSRWLMPQTSLARLWKAAYDATPAEVQAAITANRDRPAQLTMVGDVAVIDVCGPITYRESIFSWYFGGATIERLQAQFRLAQADDTVKAILWRHDSPGGTIDMVSEFAAEIFEARGRKPMVAVADVMMCSASYWLGAQADTVVVAGGVAAQVGSIGVWTMHEDISGMLEQMGVTISLMFAGDHKVDGHPFSPLSDDVRAAIEAECAEVHTEFIAAVAKARGVSAAEVRASYGQGKVYTAKDAVKLGLADRKATFDQTLAKMTGAGKRRSATQAKATVSEITSIGSDSIDFSAAAAETRAAPAAKRNTVEPDVDGQCCLPEDARATTATAADRDALDLMTALTE